jgi:hypothetical protein
MFDLCELHDYMTVGDSALCPQQIEKMYFVMFLLDVTLNAGCFNTTLYSSVLYCMLPYDAVDSISIDFCSM